MFLDTFTRRAFLKSAASAAAGAWAWLAGGGSFPSAQPARAAALKALSGAEADTLRALARTIYPHDQIGDEFYQTVVEGIDGDMAASAQLARSIKEGLAVLNQARGTPFADLRPGDQAWLVRGMEDRPFINDVKGKALVLFYNNKAVWPQLGYEGSSWEKGGYLNRGFDDIDWL